MWLPSRMTRYVLSELRHPTLLAIGLWSFLLLMNQFFLIAKEAIAKDLPVETVFRMIVYFLPNALILAIPMGTLLGTMIGVGRLSADHEWVALQSAGLGPRFLIRPVVLHGLLATAFALLVYGVAQPAASYALRALSGEILATTSMASDLRPRVFYDDLPGAVLFVNEIRPGAGGRLDGALLYQPGEANGYEQLVLAKEAFLYPVPGRRGALEIDLREGVSHSFRSTTPDSYRTYLFKRYIPALFETPAYMQALDKPPERTVQNMSPSELLRELRLAKVEKDPIIRPFRVRNAQVEIHQRIALPFACLLFALLAMPLGMTRARTGKGAGFALSLLVILVYWVVFTTARDQASLRGSVPAWFGVWSGNLVMIGWAAFAHWGMRRPPEDEPSRLTTWLAASVPSLRAAVSRLTFWRKATPAAATSEEEVSPVDTAPSGGSRRFVTLLDQYVIKLYVRLFLLALVGGYLIISIVELKDILDGVLQKGHSITLLLRYYKYFVPGNAEIVVPIACLVGGIVTFTLLGRSGELTAMKAGGVSMLRASAPVLGVTILLCAVFYLVQDRIAPVTNRKALELKDRILDRAPRTYGMPPGGRWTFGTEGRLYHYRLYDPAEKRFQGLSVYTVDLKKPRILEHRFGTTAHWDGKISKWILEKGWYRGFHEGSRTVDYRQFEGPESVQLDPPENFAQREMTLTRAADFPEQLSRGALGRQIEALRNSGFDTTRLAVEYYAKLSRPLTPLVMVLLGLPFAFKIGRRGSLYAVGVALVLVIVYWATFALFHAMGLETLLPPLLAAWAPNVLYALLGTYLMLYIKT